MLSRSSRISPSKRLIGSLPNSAWRPSWHDRATPSQSALLSHFKRVFPRLARCPTAAATPRAGPRPCGRRERSPYPRRRSAMEMALCTMGPSGPQLRALRPQCRRCSTRTVATRALRQRPPRARNRLAPRQAVHISGSTLSRRRRTGASLPQRASSSSRINHSCNTGADTQTWHNRTLIRRRHSQRSRGLRWAGLAAHARCALTIGRRAPARDPRGGLRATGAARTWDRRHLHDLCRLGMSVRSGPRASTCPLKSGPSSRAVRMI